MLLTLCGIIPMLQEINTLVKHAQQRSIYVVDFIHLRKRVCQSLDVLYVLENRFDESQFTNWRILTNIKHP